MPVLQVERCFSDVPAIHTEELQLSLALMELHLSRCTVSGPRTVVIKTACKFIWCSCRNKTDLSRTDFACLGIFITQLRKYIRAIGLLVNFCSRFFMKLDGVRIQPCVSAATQER